MIPKYAWPRCNLSVAVYLFPPLWFPCDECWDHNMSYELVHEMGSSMCYIVKCQSVYAPMQWTSWRSPKVMCNDRQSIFIQHAPPRTHSMPIEWNRHESDMGLFGGPKQPRRNLGRHLEEKCMDKRWSDKPTVEEQNIKYKTWVEQPHQNSKIKMNSKKKKRKRKRREKNQNQNQTSSPSIAELQPRSGHSACWLDLHSRTNALSLASRVRNRHSKLIPIHFDLCNVYFFLNPSLPDIVGGSLSFSWHVCLGAPGVGFRWDSIADRVKDPTMYLFP